MIHTPVCDLLRIRHPIVLGGMAGATSMPLVAAVSNAGGLGTLGIARTQISRHRPLVEVALEAGFADQAHFTRMFKAAFGITPARYGALRAHDVQGTCRL